MRTEVSLMDESARRVGLQACLNNRLFTEEYDEEPHYSNPLLPR
jgi:hypothetical protein